MLSPLCSSFTSLFLFLIQIWGDENYFKYRQVCLLLTSVTVYSFWHLADGACFMEGICEDGLVRIRVMYKWLARWFSFNSVLLSQVYRLVTTHKMRTHMHVSSQLSIAFSLCHVLSCRRMSQHIFDFHSSPTPLLQKLSHPNPGTMTPVQSQSSLKKFENSLVMLETAYL